MKNLFWLIFTVMLLAACDGEEEKNNNCENRAQLLENVNTPASSGTLPGSSFTKTWRVLNTGTCTWDKDYKVVKLVGEFISAEPMTSAVAPTPPQGELRITLTLRLSDQARMNIPQSASFQLHTPENQPFGPVLQVQVVVGNPISTTAPTSTPRVTLVPSPIPITPGVVQTGNCVNNAQFVADVTIPDGASVTAGQPFVKIWRFRNTGTCAWNNTYTISKVQGDSLAMSGTSASLPNTPPGSEVDISVTLTAALATPLGSQQTAIFQLYTPNRQPFGDQPYVLVTIGSAAPTSASGACTNNAAFVADVTIPDNTVIRIGQTYVKTWRLRNTGTCPWSADYTLIKVWGDAFTANTVQLPAVDPGAEADISVTLTMLPTVVIGQTYIGMFELRAPNGETFGEPPYIQVIAGQ